MRKKAAIALALMLTISLCACTGEEPADTTIQPTRETLPTFGTQAPTVPEVTEPSEPEEPEMLDPDMFVGQWKYMADSGVDTGMSFTIYDDGTLIKEGWDYIWTAEEADPESGYEAILQVKYAKKPGKPSAIFQNSFTLCLIRTPENTYVAKLISDELGTSTDFYRVGDYEVVELTKDNLMDYLQCERYFSYSTTASGFTGKIYSYTEVRFRSNVGYPSFCQAELQYQVSEVEVTFDEKPNGYSEGVVLKTYEARPELWGGQLPKVTGRTPYTFSLSYEWPGNKGGQTLTKIIQYWELTGADRVFGRVYIPLV